MAPQTRCGAASIVSSSTIADIVVPFCIHVATRLYLTYRLSIAEKGERCQGVALPPDLSALSVSRGGARARTARQKSRWEERTSASASSREGQPPSASARRSGVLSPSWVSTTSVAAPWSRKSSVTTVSQPCLVPPDQV